jgi:outer membrane protein assembly factor BamD
LFLGSAAFSLPPMRWALLTPALLVLAACGGGAPPGDPSVGVPAERLYAQAARELEQGNKAEAQRLFADVERLHPYSDWAGPAEVMGAYAAYADGRYAEAVEAAERYVALRPGGKDVAYAWYLRALALYAQITDSRRDQAATARAAQGLTDVMERFPDTDYAKDAAVKRDLAWDHLAGHEMTVGRYYMRRGHLGAAAGRFRVVVEQYQTTPQVPEALERLVEVYLAMGLRGEAERAAAILGHNYPGSARYARAYKLLQPDGPKALEGEKGWLDRTAEGLLGGE